jgi:class 3 adenylate cyclase
MEPMHKIDFSDDIMAKMKESCNLIPHCTVMFCTIKQHKLLLSGFSDECLDQLHLLISEFDDAVLSAGMCKYLHVGEWYIVTCPRGCCKLDFAEQRPEEYPAAYTNSMIELALNLQCIAARQATRSGEQLHLQVGLSAGPVAGAFMGADRPNYCLYGTPVNTAARLSKHATGPPTVCAAVAAAAAQAGGGRVRCVEAGCAALKGLGFVETFHLSIDGRPSSSSSDALAGLPLHYRPAGLSRTVWKAGRDCVAGAERRSLLATAGLLLLLLLLAAWASPSLLPSLILCAILAEAGRRARPAPGLRAEAGTAAAAGREDGRKLDAPAHPLVSPAPVGPRPTGRRQEPPPPPPPQVAAAGAGRLERRRAVVAQLDLCGFTALARGMRDPRELAGLVRGLFAAFDAAVAAAGLARADTVGDAYIAARFLPSPPADAAGGGAAAAADEEARACAAALRAARAMLEAVGTCRRDTGRAVSCRIGVSVGDVVVASFGSIHVSLPPPLPPPLA